jgi:hypothetical protein
MCGKQATSTLLHTWAWPQKCSDRHNEVGQTDEGVCTYIPRGCVTSFHGNSCQPASQQGTRLRGCNAQQQDAILYLTRPCTHKHKVKNRACCHPIIMLTFLHLTPSFTRQLLALPLQLPLSDYH